MQIKLIKPVLEYIFMVGLPIVGIFFILQAGASLEASMPVGKTWELQAANAAAESQVVQCYGLQLPLTLHIQQSGLFLHSEINHHPVQGKKIRGESFHLSFTTDEGICAHEKISLRGTPHKDNLLWPAVLASESCKKCAPVDIMIHRQEAKSL